MTIDNMTCHVLQQPLNHFALPRQSVPNYNQRYCVKDFADVQTVETPVLFYTGNESPLEIYINHTGLMWHLGESLQATVVFAEHRYEGKSLPPFDITNCLAYSSSVQAIADYARIIENFYKPRPVILFGGSYGGMLASWMRMKYPGLVAGAIAGSAPIWGFPLTSDSFDGAFSVIQHGIQQAYPPLETSRKSSAEVENFCADNLRAAWPLIKVLGQSAEGRALLSESFSLCSPMKHAEETDSLIDWAKSPWFDLAEGSYPYPSSYIPFALTHNPDVVLPAWPVQAACWNASLLYRDLGIRLEGNLSTVNYTVFYGDSSLNVDVNWDNVSASSMDALQFNDSKTIRLLLTSVRDAVGVWFNMTQDVQCYNLTTAPNNSKYLQSAKSWSKGALQYHSLDTDYSADHRRVLETPVSSATKDTNNTNTTLACKRRIMKGGSWPWLYCNEDMNLIITDAQGMGQDVFWPPSYPRGVHDYADILTYKQANNITTNDICKDPHGAYGLPTQPGDPWSTWLDIFFGGRRIESHSNIIFSNGLLDPWSAAGVYRVNPSDPGFADASYSPVPGLYLQNISSNSLIALLMELGGHHTDLMYDEDDDPVSIRYARRVERRFILEWIETWNEARRQGKSEL
jgi:lysosomal Pro-X carboxypeptidase